MLLSPIGKIVEKEWKRLPSIRSQYRIDEWVIMPNHFHAIVILQDDHSRASRRDAPTKARLKPRSLGAIVNHFKSNCTKRIHAAGFHEFAWQRGYHDHIIRDDGDLRRIRRYIRLNPLKWSLDPYHLPN
jgi:putative transposase